VLAQQGVQAGDLSVDAHAHNGARDTTTARDFLADGRSRNGDAPSERQRDRAADDTRDQSNAFRRGAPERAAFRNANGRVDVQA
jgi:hypothetical protein